MSHNGQSREHVNRNLVKPWQQLSNEGMTTNQILNKVGLSETPQPRNCAPGRQVSFERVVASELKKQESEG